jgi:hypothetical protein
MTKDGFDYFMRLEGKFLRSGHGWVKFKNDDQIHGEIYIHNGDSSTFVATRQNKDDKNNATIKPIR